MTRRGFLKGLLGTTLAGFFTGVYGFFVEPAWRLRVQRWKVDSPKWTAAPLRIVAISDFHLGDPYVGLDRLARIVTQANALEPDLVVLLGDYAAGHRFITAPVKITDAAPVIAGLKVPLGVFAILGNHDWWDDKSAQKRGGGPNLYGVALETAGIPVLSNRAVRLNGFWLAGVEDQLALLRGKQGIVGLDDLPGTLAQVTDDAPGTLLAHEPDIFPKVPDRVALTLSGHTQGGQVRLVAGGAVAVWQSLCLWRCARRGPRSGGVGRDRLFDPDCAVWNAARDYGGRPVVRTPGKL